MSQHDLVVANDTAASVRADLNLALQALGSQSSGASAPGTTYAYQPWADTTNGLTKQRNAANSGWLIRGTLAETLVTAVTGATSVALGDYGKLLTCSGTFSLNLTAAATMGDGWQCGIRNSGTGTITLDGSGSETIDGATTQTLSPGDSCLIMCDGSAWYTIGRAAAGRSGAIVQAVEATPYVTYSSTASAFAGGDTKMTTASGLEILSVAITPTSVANRLVCELQVFASSLTGTTSFVGLFQDSTVDALAQAMESGVTDGVTTFLFRHEMAAGTTSATTFKARVAPGTGTLYVNGIASGRRGGGNLACRLRVTEVKA